MLDLFFRKYAWTANVALLFIAAWLSAKTVNTVIGALIRPRPQADLTALPAAARPPGPASLESDKLYPLIGLEPPAPAAAEEASRSAEPAPARTCIDGRAAPVKTTLRAQLVGAVISERPEWSLATIIDLATRDTRIYGIGDAIQGAKILSVERIRDDRDGTGAGFKPVAIVCNNGSKEYLDFEPVAGAATAGLPNLGTFPTRHAGAGGDEGAPGAQADGIRKVTDNRYEIKRSVIENTLSNLNSVATQARIVPSFKNGVSNGFKLFSIQPNSFYSAIGVENGDVIQKINGYEINSPDKALEVYQKLRESSHITIEIDRNGQMVRKEYNVSGP